MDGPLSFYIVTTAPLIISLASKLIANDVTKTTVASSRDINYLHWDGSVWKKAPWARDHKWGRVCPFTGKYFLERHVSKV
jgi:hypothetical protein